MGSTASANHEWIELYNSGSSLDVTGWTLSDGMNLNIELTGTLNEKSYSVLERTSDDSAVGTAFLIYTGALVNSGATLKLTRADGTLVDQIAGGEDWVQIGGDNTTKETAQYSTSGWITAAPTPGKVNHEVGSVKIAEEASAKDEAKSQTKSAVVKKSAGEPVKLELPGVTLKVKVEGQTLGYVNQVIDFKAVSSGIGKNLLNSLEYQWNFGDGEVSATADAHHAFTYPGTYVVTVYAGFKRQEQVARHEITILPVMTSLTTNDQGDVQINNDSPYEIDISGYRLVGGKEFEFPPYSVMLPNQTVTIPRQKVGSINKNMVAFYDAKSIMVASILPTTLESTYGATLAMATPVVAKRVSAANNSAPMASDTNVSTADFNFATTADTKEAPVLVEDDVTNKPLLLQAASVITSDSNLNSGSSSNENLAYAGLVLVMVLALVALYAAPKRQEED